MLLTVLKVIGIVLLVLFALMIFILCELLFVPVCYRFSGRYDGTLNAVAQVNWCPVLFKVQAWVEENKFRYVVKLFGGVVMTNTGKKLSWLGKKIFPDDEEVEESTGAKTESFAEESISDTFTDNPNEEDTAYLKKQSYSYRQEKSGIKRKKQNSVWNRFREKITLMKEKWKQLKDRVKKFVDKKDALLKVYHSERFAFAKRDVWQYMKEFFRIVRPKELEGYVHFGLEDPSVTGNILGGISLILPLYGDFLIIQPDFERQCLDGSLNGKGKIYLFRVAKLVLKVIFNKNLIKVTKKVQTIIEA